MAYRKVTIILYYVIICIIEPPISPGHPFRLLYTEATRLLHGLALPTPSISNITDYKCLYAMHIIVVMLLLEQKDTII